MVRYSTEDCEELNLTIHQASRLANDSEMETVRSAGTSSSSRRL